MLYVIAVVLMNKTGRYLKHLLIKIKNYWHIMNMKGAQVIKVEANKKITSSVNQGLRLLLKLKVCVAD